METVGCAAAANQRGEHAGWSHSNGEHELIDVDDLLAALPRLIGRNPDRSTVRSWLNRHKLVPRKLGGREYYRGGDVIDLALDRQQCSGPKRKDRRTA